MEIAMIGASGFVGTCLIGLLNEMTNYEIKYIDLPPSHIIISDIVYKVVVPLLRNQEDGIEQRLNSNADMPSKLESKEITSPRIIKNL